MTTKGRARLSLLGDPAEQGAEIEPRQGAESAPLTYKEGDRPRLPEMVLWRSEGIWAPLHRDCLRPGDLWLPMPPPPEGQR